MEALTRSLKAMKDTKDEKKSDTTSTDKPPEPPKPIDPDQMGANKHNPIPRESIRISTDEEEEISPG